VRHHPKEEETMDRRDFIRAALGTAAAALTRIQGPEGLLAQAREAARPLNLKVTDLRTFVVDAANDENFVFVKIYTNQGIEGLGEGTLTGKEATVEQAILSTSVLLERTRPISSSKDV
jgi:galactonate dehydratase